MKRYLLALIIVILVWTQAHSQTSVSGKVMDQSKAPVPGATVSLTNQEKQEGTTTATDGTFKIELSNPGVYVIEIRFLGYDPFVKSYTFPRTKCMILV